MWKAIDFSVICGVSECIESLGSWTISNFGYIDATMADYVGCSHGSYH